MFDGLVGGRFGGNVSRFVEGEDHFSSADGSGSASFGAIASYQICACCARFHGPASAGDGAQGVILNGDDRGVYGPNGKPSLFPGDAGTQITRTNTSWANGLGQAATVTYAFRLSAPTMPEDTTGFSQFTAAQIAATQLALAAWSDVANITFVRVTDPGSQYSNNATMLFGNYASGQDGAAAFAYLPGGMPGQTGAGSAAGDVWINSSLSYNANPVLLGYGQQTLLHEIGHAIGLSHPAAYNASAGVSITYGAHATYFEDSRQYTVMSYFSETNTGADFRATGGGNRYASAPLMDDIAAAQRLYGANMTTRTGDTVYGFNSNAGLAWFSAASASSPLVFCVWDAGGTDTFDFSGYASGGVIDLRQGAFSSVGGLLGNVSIAVGAVIENAIGGAGAETIRGNSGANVIQGGGGNDIIDGGLGIDTAVFSGLASSYTIVWNGQRATVTGADGVDQLINVEFFRFADVTIAATPTGGLTVAGDITNETINGSALADNLFGLGGADTINGLDGNDYLEGGSGNDVLNGGSGDDILVGGAGDDALNGGDGYDIVDYSTSATVLVDGAPLVVNLATGLGSGGAGADTYSGIEEVIGTSGNDIITGDGGANVLRGGGGVDTLNGGGGDDILWAGVGGETGGAPDIVKGRGVVNSTFATAVSLTGAFDLQARTGVENATTIPHATVLGTASGQLEYYAVTVAAGDTVRFDIDGASFDSALRLFDASGAELAQNDDASAADSDGSGATDSLLTYTFATAGTYYIQVSQWSSSGTGTGFGSAPAPAGGRYQLNVSVPSATVVPSIITGSTLNGGDGADILNGHDAADTLNGGAGDDRIFGGGGNDQVDGGDGTDTFEITGLRADYTISTVNGVTTITGASGVDTLRNVEQLRFSDGLYGINGAPLAGEPINGTPNADVLTGTAGADIINGLDGDDVITGAGGNDTIDGGAGVDTAVFSGTIGQSTVSTTNGVTTVTGPDGTDTLTNVERLRFSDGTLIVGAGGGQYFEGTSNADVIAGTGFNDEIRAGGGDDLVSGGAGDDTIDGGEGADTAVFSGERAAYTLSTVSGVTTVSGADGVDSLVSIERLQFTDGYYTVSGEVIVNVVSGTAGDDVLNGGLGVDAISGGAGNDVIRGFGGADVLNGGPGSDVIDGGEGIDTLQLDRPAASYYFEAIDGGGWRVHDGAVEFDTVTNVELVSFAGGPAVGMAAGAASGFDAYRYMAGYADLTAAFRNSPVDAYRHYIETGQFEGRSPTAFDALRYLASNPDLISSFGVDERRAAAHYVEAGSIEGRSTTSFDPLIYAASNVDLAQVFGTDEAALTLHYLHTGLAEGRATNAFDPLIYLASNPDLAQTIGNDAAAGVSHYITSGLAEGRATTGFDARLYLASHTDLLAVYGNDPAAALNHYLTAGAAEGRATSGFDALRYIASNVDLALTFGMNADAGLEHFLIVGLPEGRSTTSFDPLVYIASNTDLTAVLGANPEAGLEHYLLTGAIEGRSTSSFSAEQYLAANSDLAAVFGLNLDAAVNHYLGWGFDEGRPISGFDPVAYLLSNPDLAGMSAAQALQHWLAAGAAEGRAGDSMFGREQAGGHVLTGSVSDQLAVADDRDWFELSAAQGEVLTLSLSGAGSGGGTLQDGYLRIYDAHGHLLAEDDNSGPGADAMLTFAAPLSGVFYVVVTGSTAGSYQLSVSATSSAVQMMVDPAQLPQTAEDFFPNKLDPSDGPQVLPELPSDLFYALNKSIPGISPPVAEVLPAIADDFVIKTTDRDPLVLPDVEEPLSGGLGPRPIVFEGGHGRALPGLHPLSAEESAWAHAPMIDELW